MDVRAIRRKLNLTQAALAEQIPTTIRTITRWENDDMRPNQMARARLRAIVQEFQRRQHQSDGPQRRALEASDSVEIDAS